MMKLANGLLRFMSTYKKIILCNLVFLLHFLNIPNLINISRHPGLFTFLSYYQHSITTNIIIFIIPGVCFLALLKKEHKSATSFFMWSFVVSVVTHLLVLMMCIQMRLAPIEQYSFFIIVILSNLFLIIGVLKKANFKISSRRFKTRNALILLFTYTFLFIYSFYFEPLKTDHDFPAAHTTYSMVHFLKPYGGETCNSPYFLTRPFLFLFIPACSFLYSDAVADMKPFYEQVAPYIKDGTKIIFENKDPRLFKRFRNEWDAAAIDYSRTKKWLIITRIPFIFLGALVVLYLFMCIYALFKSDYLAYLGLAIFITQPEVVLRSGCSSSETMILFFVIVIMYLRYFQGYNGLLLLILSLFGMASNQQMIFFPFALFLAYILEFFQENKRDIKTRFQRLAISICTDKIILGCAIGYMVLIIYWFSVDIELARHLLRKYFLNPLNEASNFHEIIHPRPERVATLLDYNSNTGIVLMPIASLIAIYCMALPRIKKVIKVASTTFFSVIILYYLADSDFTRHYYFSVVSMTLLICAGFAFISNYKRWLSAVFLSVLCIVIFRNIWIILAMPNDLCELGMSFGASF